MLGHLRRRATIGFSSRLDGLVPAKPSCSEATRLCVPKTWSTPGPMSAHT
jgi:hypothetical protein